MFDGDESEGPRGTFEIYKAEADSLFKQGEYRKSIESYTTVSSICTIPWTEISYGYGLKRKKWETFLFQSSIYFLFYEHYTCYFTYSEINYNILFFNEV